MGVIGQVLILPGVMTGCLAPAVTAGYLVLAAGNLAIWIWFVVAAVCYGPCAALRSRQSPELTG